MNKENKTNPFDMPPPEEEKEEKIKNKEKKSNVLFLASSRAANDVPDETA